MAHFFFWNVLTAGFVENSIIGVIMACLAILIVGKQLEPLWGSKELLRFLLVSYRRLRPRARGAAAVRRELCAHISAPLRPPPL